MRELGAGSHSRLAEDVRKVRLDRLGAQKEPRGDVSIRQAGCDESCNLELLRGQLVEGRRVAPTRALTGRPELGPCAIGPELAADGLEALECGPEGPAGVSAALPSRRGHPVREQRLRLLGSACARERLDERRQDRPWRNHLRVEALATQSQ